MDQPKCYYCNKTGHFKSDCRFKERKEHAQDQKKENNGKKTEGSKGKKKDGHGFTAIALVGGDSEKAGDSGFQTVGPVNI